MWDFPIATLRGEAFQELIRAASRLLVRVASPETERSTEASGAQQRMFRNSVRVGTVVAIAEPERC